MPINKQMMADLIKRYGGKKGQDVYYAIENKRKHGKKKPRPTK